MSKSSTILKPYLRKFILEIHPDFFHNDPIKKRVNATSLQKLHNVFNKEHKPESCQLQFFTKQQKKREQPKTKIEFSPHDSDWIKTSHVLNLCKQANIPIVQSDLDIVQEMISKELNQDKRAPYKSLTKEFAEQLYKHHNKSVETKEWKPKEIMNHRLVQFVPIDNKRAASKKLSTWLPQLQPEHWWGRIPIMVLSSTIPMPPKELTKGILVVHGDMKVEDVKAYFKDNLERIIAEHNQKE